jgi:hypothetical protein
MEEHEPLREQEVGVVTHYWGHIEVAGVHLTGPLDVGDRIHVLGHTSDFDQVVESMQFDHREIVHADADSDVAIKVVEHAREHDKIFKVVEAAELGEDQSDL